LRGLALWLAQVPSLPEEVYGRNLLLLVHLVDNKQPFSVRDPVIEPLNLDLELFQSFIFYIKLRV
jgi:hypothetical protein